MRQVLLFLFHKLEILGLNNVLYLRNTCSIVRYSIQLEEKMATHSNILVGKIPRTEKPRRLQSMGLQRVEHD